jgi:hypothetical protein
MLTGSAIRRAVALAALFTPLESQAQELNEVALAYLQRHGVPCPSVARVDRAVQEFDFVATCHDGRRWALFFVEGEVALLQPATGEPYKWRREVYASYPEVYLDAEPSLDSTTPKTPYAPLGCSNSPITSCARSCRTERPPFSK